MMSQTGNEFDDPQLKDALQRLYGQTRADAALRQRALDALDAGSSPQPMKIGPGRSVWKIAAGILLLIGAAGSIGYQLFEPRWRAARAQALAEARGAENDRLEKAALYGWMVDQLLVTPSTTSTQAVLPAGEIAAAIPKFSQSLGREVPAMQAAIGPWTLTQAAVVPMHQWQAARFDYANGDRHVVFVSVPIAAAMKLQYANKYDITYNGHAIAGFVANDGLHCIVGDSQMTTADAIAFRDAVRAKL